MSNAKSAPDLKIPRSEHTVSVSIIDTTVRITGLPVAAFTQPQIDGYSTIVGGCAYAFLIKHHNSATKSKHDTLLFDLGVRKDVQNSPKVVVDQAVAAGFQMEVKKNVYDILQDEGDDPAKVGGIIWSHYHVVSSFSIGEMCETLILQQDHTGDPATFPKDTDLIVGPGFKQSFVPAWPTKEDSPVDEKAWEGRELREISFDGERSLKLGQYKAYDFYGDGSFYLIDSPGHAVGHMCALARTSASPPTFVLVSVVTLTLIERSYTDGHCKLGGDVAHHGSEFRPTEYVPLPKSIEPNPLVAPFATSTFVCPGSIYEAMHPKKSSTEPFVQALGFIHDDARGACASVEKLLEFDAQDNIFSVIAHDLSLIDLVDFYPKTIDDWKKRGWKEQGHWRFLRDFDTGNDEYKPQ